MGLDKKVNTIQVKQIKTKGSVGYWKQDTYQVHLIKKPNWFQRTIAKIVLGWVWYDKV